MQIVKLRERYYERTLNEIVDRVYSLSGERGWSWPELAERAGVCYGTVWHIGNRVTKLPRFRTVYLLCRAVGARLELLEPRAKARAEA